MKQFYAFVVLLFSFLAFTESLQTFQKLCDVRDFEDFLQQTGKVYNDPTERKFRESIFLAKKGVVDMGNKYAALGASTFNMAINTLADLTHDEVAHLYGSKITFTGE